MTIKSHSRKLKIRVQDRYDLVPLEIAVFLWNHEPDASGDWPEDSLVVVPQILDHVDHSAFSSSTGADTEGWPTAAYNNPGFIFGQLMFRKWKSEAERIEAIAEFAKITEIDWAREILRGIAFNLGAFQTDEDESHWTPISTIEDVNRFRDASLSALAEQRSQ